MRAQELVDAFGYLYQAEFEFLIELVQSLPDNPLVVNIGCGVGTSGLTVLEARTDSFLVSVDNHDRVRPEGALGNERFQMKRSKLLARRGEIHSDSARAGKKWNNYKNNPWWRTKIDMVFHDAAHGFDSLIAEIEAWLPRVKAKGIIAVHDYVFEPWGEVMCAVDDVLVPKYKLIDQSETLIAFRKEKV